MLRWILCSAHVKKDYYIIIRPLEYFLPTFQCLWTILINFKFYPFSIVLAVINQDKLKQKSQVPSYSVLCTEDSATSASLAEGSNTLHCLPLNEAKVVASMLKA